ncbi:MAG: hypothetical protein F4X83_00225 [Chloroflexi bacterium]|nr:hypothetical protein [Chloroflexota bacterium]
MKNEGSEMKQIEGIGCLDCSRTNYAVKAMFEGSREGNYYVTLFLECKDCERINKVLFSDSEDILQEWQDIFTTANRILEIPEG